MTQLCTEMFKGALNLSKMRRPFADSIKNGQNKTKRPIQIPKTRWNKKSLRDEFWDAV